MRRGKERGVEGGKLKRGRKRVKGRREKNGQKELTER